MSEDSDEALMRGIAAGEERALRALAERHLERMRRLARKTLGSDAEADDVAQEALIRVWTHAASWRPESAALRSRSGGPAPDVGWTEGEIMRVLDGEQLKHARADLRYPETYCICLTSLSAISRRRDHDRNAGGRWACGAGRCDDLYGREYRQHARHGRISGVRYWHLADVPTDPLNVRYWG